MTDSTKRIMVRNIQRRIESGETFDEAISHYPKLTPSEVEELRQEFEVE